MREEEKMKNCASQEVGSVKFGEIAKAYHNENDGGRSACNDFSCDYFRCICAKEEFSP